MNQKDPPISTARAPAAGPTADRLRGRLEPLWKLASQRPLPCLTPAQRAAVARTLSGASAVTAASLHLLRRRPELTTPGSPGAEGLEERLRQREALLRLRQVALDVAQAAANGALVIEAEIGATNERIRQTAAELSRDTSRPLHERMLLLGLWAPLPDLPPSTVRRQRLRRRREAARARRSRTSS